MKRLRGAGGSPSDPGGLVGPQGSAPASTPAPDDFSRYRRAAARMVELCSRFPSAAKSPSAEWWRRVAASDDAALLELWALDPDEFDLMVEEDAPTPGVALQKRNERIYKEVRASMPKPGPDPAPEEEHNKKYRPLRDECIRACGGDMKRARGEFIRRAGRKPYFSSSKTAQNVWSLLGRARREK